MSLDRVGAPVPDRNSARLALFGLGDPNLEHAVGEARLDAVRVDATGERQRARERPGCPLDSEGALVALLAPVRRSPVIVSTFASSSIMGTYNWHGL
jgi:hypothetical protein